MRCYWSNWYDDGDGYGTDLSDGIGYCFGDGYSDRFHPSVLVTGVKLEEVGLNASLLV